MIEQPENRQAIQQIVARLTGVEPVVTLKILPAEAPKAAPKSEPSEVQQPVAPPPPRPAAQPAPQVKGRSTLRIREDIDPEKDAFVQQVVETFGATVVRVTDAPVRRPESEQS